jgi:hypothetical protein
MSLRALGILAHTGGLAATGLAYGAASGAVGAATGLGYLGYRAMFGYGRVLNDKRQLGMGIQARLMGGAAVYGAGSGMLQSKRQPYSVDSSNGNLEVDG